MADVRGTFTKELALIQNDLITMGQLVTQALADAVEALKTKNKDLADSVIAGDDKIDEMQVIIEDKTVELIALQQPIAKDLRILSTAMKMTTDLERIGDHAKKIAKIANRIGQDPLIKPLVDIPIAAQMVPRGGAPEAQNPDSCGGQTPASAWSATCAGQCQSARSLVCPRCSG